MNERIERSAVSAAKHVVARCKFRAAEDKVVFFNTVAAWLERHSKEVAETHARREPDHRDPPKKNDPPVRPEPKHEPRPEVDPLRRPGAEL